MPQLRFISAIIIGRGRRALPVGKIQIDVLDPDGNISPKEKKVLDGEHFQSITGLNDWAGYWIRQIGTASRKSRPYIQIRTPTGFQRLQPRDTLTPKPQPSQEQSE